MKNYIGFSKYQAIDDLYKDYLLLFAIKAHQDNKRRRVALEWNTMMVMSFNLMSQILIHAMNNIAMYCHVLNINTNRKICLDISHGSWSG